jgi:hypothetical protein
MTRSEVSKSSRLERQPCGICGQRDLVVLGLRKVDGKIPALLPGYSQVRIVKCPRCHFYFADPMAYFSNEHFQTSYSE